MEKLIRKSLQQLSEGITNHLDGNHNNGCAHIDRKRNESQYNPDGTDNATQQHAEANANEFSEEIAATVEAHDECISETKRSFDKACDMVTSVALDSSAMTEDADPRGISIVKDLENVDTSWDASRIEVTGLNDSFVSAAQSIQDVIIPPKNPIGNEMDTKLQEQEVPPQPEANPPSQSDSDSISQEYIRGYCLVNRIESTLPNGFDLPIADVLAAVCNAYNTLITTPTGEDDISDNYIGLYRPSENKYGVFWHILEKDSEISAAQCEDFIYEKEEKDGKIFAFKTHFTTNFAHLQYNGEQPADNTTKEATRFFPMMHDMNIRAILVTGWKMSHTTGSFSTIEEDDFTEENKMCFSCITISTRDGPLTDCNAVLQKFIAAVTMLLTQSSKRA